MKNSWTENFERRSVTIELDALASGWLCLVWRPCFAVLLIMGSTSRLSSGCQASNCSLSCYRRGRVSGQAESLEGQRNHDIRRCAALANPTQWSWTTAGASGEDHQDGQTRQE